MPQGQAVPSVGAEYKVSPTEPAAVATALGPQGDVLYLPTSWPAETTGTLQIPF